MLSKSWESNLFLVMDTFLCRVYTEMAESLQIQAEEQIHNRTEDMMHRVVGQMGLVVNDILTVDQY
jgi:hypothetical protein